MLRRLLIVSMAFALLGHVGTSTTSAWDGETWQGMRPGEISRRAFEMMDSSWSPRNTITNWQWGSTWCTFTAGRTYVGEAYSQGNHRYFPHSPILLPNRAVELAGCLGDPASLAEGESNDSANAARQSARR